MKVTVDIDCTPEEARRFMGLPDLSAVHEAYLSKLRTAIDQGISPDAISSMVQNWAPMGEAGLKIWSQMLENIGGTIK